MLELKKPVEHPMREFLQENKISQQEIAFALGVSQSAVSLILAGWRKPTPKIQKKLDELMQGLTQKAKRKAA